MNFVEKTCIAVRHSAPLRGAEWLWNAVRPIYNLAVNLSSWPGLERTMNGTDRILVCPRFRGIGEIYEPEVWRHFMSSVNAGDIIADVGAHIGLYTAALARRLAPKGRVIAFEPHEQNFNALTHHVKINRLGAVVETVRAAVGVLDGEVAFTGDQDVQNRI